MTPLLNLPKRAPDSIPLVADAPFAACYRHWQLAPGKDSLTIVAKATFDIVPDARVRPSADPPSFSGDVNVEGAELLHYPSDFELFKPRADLLLVGHAYARAREPLARVLLRFGEHSFTLVAIGDRRWDAMGASTPEHFHKLPLRYDRAFGGPGYASNPLGIGFAHGSASIRLPNLEHPERLIRSPADRPVPACFAPVPREWPERASKLGSYDSEWLNRRWPYFPSDYDPSYANAAPAALRIPYPKGHESFDLGGVHPELLVVRGQLAGVRARAFAQYGQKLGFRFEEIPMLLDTLWFDADALQLILVWRGGLEVSGEFAPELAALFVTADAVEHSSDARTLRQRFSERLSDGDAQAELGARLPLGRRSTIKAPEPRKAPNFSAAQITALLSTGLALSGMDLSHADLSGADLRRRKLRGTLLIGAKLDDADLSGADLSDAVLTQASLDRARLNKARLGHANLTGATLQSAELREANLDGALLERVNFEHADLDGCRARHASFCRARLSSAKLRGADLRAADFSEARLERTNFETATLEDAQFYDADASHCRFDRINAARLRADGGRFEGCSFAGSALGAAVFKAAQLDDANFEGATLEGAVFAHARLPRARFDGAKARDVRFEHGDLSQASFAGANLMRSNFEGAELRGANLSRANLYQAETWRANLDGVALEGAVTASSKLARR